MSDPRASSNRGGTLPRLVLAALLTTVVALYNQFPLTYPDSGNYLENAQSLVRLQRPWFFFRPLTYGAFLVPFASPYGLWLIPLVQGGLVAWVVDLCLRAVGRPLPTGRFLALFAGLSLFTSLAWFSGQIMPDIFTGLVILLCFLAVWGEERLSRRERWAAGTLLAFAIGTHLSHFPLYGLLAVPALTLRLALDPGSREPRALGPLGFRVLAPAVAAAGFLVGSNLYFHREPVLSRSSSLFALAHLVGDSLAQAYLDRACPAKGYLICAERNSLRAEVDWFLWDAEGTWRRHEADLQRGDSTFLTEASDIVRGTLRQEWRAAVAASLRNTAVQVGTFGLHRGELAYSGSVDRALARLDAASARGYQASRQLRGALPLDAINVVQYGAVGLGLLVLAIALPKLRGSPVRRLATIVCLGVLLNAVVMASLARVHPRYQSRVVWLVPLVAAVAALQLAGHRAYRRDGRDLSGGDPRLEIGS
jgi:hypothetical protein